MKTNESLLYTQELPLPFTLRETIKLSPLTSKQKIKDALLSFSSLIREEEDENGLDYFSASASQPCNERLKI